MSAKIYETIQRLNFPTLLHDIGLSRNRDAVGNINYSYIFCFMSWIEQPRPCLDLGLPLDSNGFRPLFERILMTIAVREPSSRRAA